MISLINQNFISFHHNLFRDQNVINKRFYFNQMMKSHQMMKIPDENTFDF